MSFDGVGDTGAGSDASSNGEWIGQSWNDAGDTEASGEAPSDDSASSRLVDNRDATDADVTVPDIAIGSSGGLRIEDGSATSNDARKSGAAVDGDGGGSSSSGGRASSASSSSGGGSSNGSSGTGSGASSSGSGAWGSGGGSSGIGSSSSSDSGAGSGDGDVADGSACVCSGGQGVYAMTGFDCAAIVIDPQLPPGQAKKVCKNAAGFVEATLACGQLGTYVTCDAVADAAGLGLLCQVATRTSVMQQCR